MAIRFLLIRVYYSNSFPLTFPLIRVYYGNSCLVDFSNSCNSLNSLLSNSVDDLLNCREFGVFSTVSSLLTPGSFFPFFRIKHLDDL